ncbi:hypothetical protein ACQEU5_07345 [Marinactinospora thermotolerans]|uniref:hypothetical protein n=1 Tax=Marinactinospora thermotolerans TaxID=531310 RepID=UPI003D94060A
MSSTGDETIPSSQFHMSSVLAFLEESSRRKEIGNTTIERAVSETMTLYRALKEEGNKAPGSFRADFTRLLNSGRNPVGISLYGLNCLIHAQRGRTDGFPSACVERSALQIIADEFMDWEQELDERIREELEDFEEIDETIREVSDEAPPFRENEIPGWIPSSHWWWRAPHQQDMSETEREDRLYYDQYDGLETPG